MAMFANTMFEVLTHGPMVARGTVLISTGFFSFERTAAKAALPAITLIVPVGDLLPAARAELKPRDMRPDGKTMLIAVTVDSLRPLDERAAALVRLLARMC